MKMIETIISGIIIGMIVFFAVYFTGKHTDRRLVEKLQAKGAYTPQTAVRPEEAGITDEWHKRVLKRLAKEGKVVVTEDGRYYVIKK
jgi:hypothetical protein